MSGWILLHSCFHFKGERKILNIVITFQQRHTSILNGLMSLQIAEKRTDSLYGYLLKLKTVISI